MNNWYVSQILKESNYKTVGRKQLLTIADKFDRLVANLNTDPPLANTPLDTLKIDYKVFSVEESVDVRLSTLYAEIAKVFHCKLIWTEELYPGNNIVKTFEICGPIHLIPYVQRCCGLIHHNLKRFVKDQSRIKARRNRADRVKARRNGIIAEHTDRENAHKYARELYREHSEKMSRYILSKLSALSYYEHYMEFNNRLEVYITNMYNLDYKLWAKLSKRKYLSDALARPGIFHKNRIVA